MEPLSFNRRLRQWAHTEHGDQAVASSENVPNDKETTWDGSQFYTSVLYFKALLESRNEISSAAGVVLYCSNSLHFAVAFVALATLGKKILLPPNGSPGALSTLLAEYHCLVADSEVLMTLPEVDIGRVDIEKLFAEFDPAAWVENNSAYVADAELMVDAQHVEIVVYTSGSSGQPKAIVKPLCCYVDEVNFLEQQWGHLVGDCRVVASVSHQHVYGLLFRLLWPLLSGRNFCARLLQFPEELISCDQPYILISSPAYLARLKRHSVGDSEVSVNKVFSSGGPLAQADRFAIQAMLQTQLVEVFGSSETGGVAYRERSGPEDSLAWQPMAPVTIAQTVGDGCLRVKSPFIGCDDWFEMADRVQLLPDGRFELLGRTDTIVKIEEKRISLAEVEQLILLSDWVCQCKLVVLQGGRTQLGAVVQLTDAGAAMLAEKGKFTLTQQLRGMLAKYLERVVIPRKWRFVAKLPYNSQGKLTQQDLAALFET